MTAVHRISVLTERRYTLLHFDFNRQQVIDHVGFAIGIALHWLRST
jgi:hypothetical protein